MLQKVKRKVVVTEVQVDQATLEAAQKPDANAADR